MTAVNLFFVEGRAIVATDTAISRAGVAEPIGHTSKAIAFPHSRLIVAGCGPRQFVSLWQSTLLVGGPDSLDVDELDALAPSELRRIWAKFVGADCGARIFHVGVDRQERIKAFVYSSRGDFESQRIEQGAPLLCPGLEEDRTPTPEPTREQAPSTESRASVAASDLPAAFVWSWRDGVRTVIDAMPRQRSQSPPGFIGGRLHVSELTPEKVSQFWLGEIQDPRIG